MILKRSRPALIETPLEVFDRGIFTIRTVLRALAVRICCPAAR
jgi:hypothetical protein